MATTNKKDPFEYAIMPVRVGTQVVNVRVCTDHDKVAKSLARYPDGIVPEDGGDDPEFTEMDRRWLLHTAQTLANKKK